MANKKRCDVKKPEPPSTLTDEALFVIPARLTRPFFTQLYAACEARVFEHFNEEIRPVVRAVSNVDHQFDSDEVTRILEREFRMNPDRIKFLVVVPTDSEALSKAVEAVSRKHRVPVIALTLPFHRWPKESTPPPVILCQSDEGTRQLAQVAVHELRKRDIDREVHVWVMPGARRVDSMWRIRGFRRGLREKGIRLAGGRAKKLDFGQWQRQVAYDVMLRQVNERANQAKEHGGSSEPVDIVFAANDEMALGVRDAIRELSTHKETSSLVAECIVFGFDAIGEASSLIEKNNGDRWLKGTVAQQLPKMAHRLVELMQQLRSRQSQNGICDVPPRIVCHRTAQLEMESADLFPDGVPAFTVDKFISATELARMEQTPSKGSLQKYRQRGIKDMSDEIGPIGRDEYGRVYRIDDSEEVQYLRGTAFPHKRRKRTSEEG